ncbi:hypothetical protein EW146_g1402 [Bondarzewia mesenterica]|uniref:Exonuclease domain-containing protein n=1 Tax=Bondarzewia mesenterica TaxID=1095465 RepID=A0A4S4M3W4_9AGAM|nr:hypothetical protein EW146_g1402 [Bondarzewia mesenterica]
MFSSLGLFQSLPCPAKPQCQRTNCLFSHRPDVVEKSLSIPHDEPQPVASSSSSSTQSPRSSVPAKRPAAVSASPSISTTKGFSSTQPPRKIQKVGTVQKPFAVPTASYTPTGVPVLRVNASQSKIPVSTRQAMLKSLYDHFVILYNALLPQDPSLASEHALRQEEEIYSRANKITYRNAVITSIASIKSRPLPTSPSHPSVGTAGDLKARAAEAHALSSLRLSSAHLTPLLLTLEELERWGYLLQVPAEWGAGGEQPSAVGSRTKCERCAVTYVVGHRGEGRAEAEECTYHWGKVLTRLINDFAALHSRHPFSPLRRYLPSSPSVGKKKKSTALEIAALDCEMIYTTGGFRVARVSVVDGNGKMVFDEIVKMDDGVEVVDFNTRFSGLTAEHYAEHARLQLADVRHSLDTLLNQDTILLGHGLENDLRTLRIVHHRCVDTAILFPHPRGFPFRRALRDLCVLLPFPKMCATEVLTIVPMFPILIGSTKEHLGRTIQVGGGTSGHSSVEDSVATLDLVKWFVHNKKTKPNPLTAPPSTTGTSTAAAMGVGSFNSAMGESKTPVLNHAVL